MATDRTHLRDEVQLAPLPAQEASREEESPRERYVAGPTPGPTAEADAGDTESASQLAFAEDDRERELKAKIQALVSARYGGDYQRAFEAYAGPDGAIERSGLSRFLADAGVGNGLTRGAWVSGIMKRLDSNGDGKIQWDELQRIATATA